MRRRGWDELTLVYLQEQTEFIDFDDLRQVLLEKPSEIVYVVTDDRRLSGCVTTGDIFRSVGGRVCVNSKLTVMNGWNSILARKWLKEKSYVHKIPVVDKQGKLLGDYSRWDDGYYFDRCKKELETVFTKDAGIGKKFLLLKPSGTSGLARYEVMKGFMKEKDIPFDTANYLEFLSGAGEWEKNIVLFADIDEYKGIQGANGEPFKTETDTYQSWISACIGRRYHESVILKNLEARGVHCITINENSSGSSFAGNYFDRKERRRDLCRTVPPIVPFEQERERFFGELCREEYIGGILAPYLQSWSEDKGSIDFNDFQYQFNGINRLKDKTGRYYNVRNGERHTVGQPEHAAHTVYFLGPCIFIGAFVSDEYTIESCLQKECGRSGESYRIVNLGAFNNGIDLARLNTLSLRSGDVVVIYTFGEDYGKYGLDAVNLFEIAEKHEIPDEWTTDAIVHTNHKWNQILAEELLKRIFCAARGGRCRKEQSEDVKAEVVKRMYLDRYFDAAFLKKYCRIGSIVMNCNPFTLGHRYLIEQAYAQVDFLIIFVVEEDKSIYSFEERYAMVKEGTKDLDRVQVVPSGAFLLSDTTFPQYFIKMKDEDLIYSTEYDVLQFAKEIARPLNISCRFVGEELSDPVTEEYNAAMKKILPGEGIEAVEIPRMKIEGRTVSASLVRELLEKGETERVRELTPESVLPYL